MQRYYETASFLAWNWLRRTHLNHRKYQGHTWMTDTCKASQIPSDWVRANCVDPTVIYYHSLPGFNNLVEWNILNFILHYQIYFSFCFKFFYPIAIIKLAIWINTQKVFGAILMPHEQLRGDSMLVHEGDRGGPGYNSREHTFLSL